MKRSNFSKLFYIINPLEDTVAETLVARQIPTTEVYPRNQYQYEYGRLPFLAQ